MDMTPSFVIRFRFLYLPFSTITGFLNNSQTNSIKNPTIPTRKDIVIIQFGMLSRLTNDNPTFMPLNVICMAIGISRFSVESLTKANTQPKKNPYNTEPGEKCKRAKKRLLTNTALSVPAIRSCSNITPRNTYSSTTAGTNAKTIRQSHKG